MRKSKYDFPEGFRYYDEGWNARCDDQPNEPNASIDWGDGWLDCDEAIKEGEKPEKI